VDFAKSGKYNGIQKYKCKSCNRYFSDKVRKFSYDDKSKFLDLYLNNVGIRKAARFMGCSSSMPVRWIKEFAENLRRQLSKATIDLDTKIPDIIEMDEIYTRIKKGKTEFRYGLLIADGEARLLRLPSAEKAGAR
jgi:transposase-like protein